MMFSYGLKVNGKIFAVVREEAIRRETSEATSRRAGDCRQCASIPVTAGGNIEVVLNWTEELKRTVPN